MLAINLIGWRMRFLGKSSASVAKWRLAGGAEVEACMQALTTHVA
jgi:hypothetical protein